MSDFEQRRREQEAARREAAAQRDAARRDALAQGGRAPSAADGSGNDAAKVVLVLAGGVAAVSMPIAVLTWGTVMAAPAIGIGITSTVVAFAAFRFRAKAGARAVAGEARLEALAGSVGSGAPWQEALNRASEAVRTSALEPERAAETLEALDAAAAEIAELNRKRLMTGGKDLATRTAERTQAFIANCDEIAQAVAPASPAGPTAGDALDAITSHLSAEAEARAELDEALRLASRARRAE